MPKRTSNLYDIFLESTGVSIDTRTLKAGQLFFALRGPNFDANTFINIAIDKGALYVVTEDQAFQNNSRVLVVKDSLETLQNLAKTHRSKLTIPIIAIGGSNGKTTTKELTGKVLSQQFNTFITPGNFNNHIGVPLSILKIDFEIQIAVLELGANHIGEIDFLCELARPTHGYITNVGLDHLEGFGSEEGVVQANVELYHFLAKNNGQVFFNSLHPELYEASIQISRRISFPQVNDDLVIQAYKSNPMVSLKLPGGTICQSHLPGKHNFENLSAAAAIGLSFGVSEQDIAEAIAAYHPVNNRSQILKYGAHTILLDAYNANPSSMKAAVDTLKDIANGGETVVMLGDMFEMGSRSFEVHHEVCQYLLNNHIGQAYLYGTHFMECAPDFPEFTFTKSLSGRHFLRLINTPNPLFLLIKGSRGMQMETLLDKIQSLEN